MVEVLPVPLDVASVARNLSDLKGTADAPLATEERKIVFERSIMEVC